MKKLEDYNTHIITYNDNNYPKNLKLIDNYPVCLFYKGNINILNEDSLLAITGCKNYSQYGKKIAIDFAYKLSKKGIIIVSGGARGIDSFSHLGAIAAGRPTIEVLGNSLDYIYPSENKELEEKILDNQGLIISEYSKRIKLNRDTLRGRDRIMAAISDSLLVVEEENDNLIIVDDTLNQGKNVYAVPGDIGRKSSIGTNKLIKQGAIPVTCIEDILEN